MLCYPLFFANPAPPSAQWLAPDLSTSEGRNKKRASEEQTEDCQTQPPRDLVAMRYRRA